MRHRPLIVVALVGLLSLLAGCQTAVDQANSISQSIQAHSAKVDAAVNVAVTHSTTADAKVVDAEQHVVSAEQHAKAADTVVQKVIAAPETPAPTKTALAPVHTELQATTADLQAADPDLKVAHTETVAVTTTLLPVHVETAAINTGAVKGAQVTAKVQTDLTAEKNHWVGYKGRVLIRNIAIGVGSIALVLGIIVFIVKTNGGQPILAAFGSIGGGIIKNVASGAETVWGYIWTGIKYVGTALWHVMTLGLSKLADVVNHQKAVAAANGVVSPAIPAAPSPAPDPAPAPNAADPNAPVT